jgi:cytochrome c-type biogenesis protein CcmH/NrfF
VRIRLSWPVALLAVLALAAPAGAAEPQTTLPDVEDEVMCVECGTALNISNSPVAEREREFIRRRIADGLTKPQIKAALVEEYGDRVLAEPRDGGLDAAAWAVPSALVLLGLGGIAYSVRRWRRRGGPADDPIVATAPALDPADTGRLDGELAAFDR